jgi:hypothetical protein
VVLDPLGAGSVRTVVVGCKLAARGGGMGDVFVDGRHPPDPEDQEEGDEGAKDTKPHPWILHERGSQLRCRRRRAPLLLSPGGTRLPLEKEAP